MLLLIDNYDSFTWNLVHELGVAHRNERRAGAPALEVRVARNDALDVAGAMALQPDAIVLSPGPCDPDRAGVCLGLVAAAAEAGVPLLGVCLGHQTIGQAFGGRVVRGPEPMHGKTSAIAHRGLGLFEALPDPLTATRYHSLVVERASLPPALEIVAESGDGQIMGLRHRALPIHGVQFHPESIATEHGRALLARFLKLAELL